MTEARWAAMAASAMVTWGGGDTAPVLVKARENVVFDVRLANGRRAALRLHRPGYQSRRSIEAELIWTGRLAEAGIPVPAPIRSRAGRQTERIGDRLASMVVWLPGAPIGAAERRLDGTPTDQHALMRRVGALLAGLHAATDALTIPEAADRPRWDATGYLGERPLWGRFWENPSLNEDERAIVQSARSAAREALEAPAIAGLDFGLIHADALRENILWDGEQLSLIDFDDSGTGWRFYDLATAIYQSLEEPALDRIVGGVLEGYDAARALPERAETILVLFLMLRAFASTGWIATRADPADPRQRFRAERALRMARHVLAGTTPWGSRQF